MSKNSRKEARRVMQICNACRYCEGLCAVFPAMVKRRSFTDQDLDYMANLCHNCQACYHGCQYAPPHEFDLNVPKAMSALRTETWLDYAWPKPLARLFKRNGFWLFVLMSLGIAVALMAVILSGAGNAFFQTHPNGDFYQLIPHNALVWIAGPIFGFALVALLMTIRTVWRDTHSPPVRLSALWLAMRDALSLRYLSRGEGGGTKGCNIGTEQFSMARRYYHHATFYGFMLCFAATVVGTIYHYLLGWQAPYAYLSLPVILGAVGGIALCIGTTGLFWLKRKLPATTVVKANNAMEHTFIFLLFATSFSGLVLTVLRETPLLGMTFVIHLGFVLALFASIPYSKMVHGVYRFAALVRFHLEQQQTKAR